MAICTSSQRGGVTSDHGLTPASSQRGEAPTDTSRKQCVLQDIAGPFIVVLVDCAKSEKQVDMAFPPWEHGR